MRPLIDFGCNPLDIAACRVLTLTVGFPFRFAGACSAAPFWITHCPTSTRLIWGPPRRLILACTACSALHRLTPARVCVTCTLIVVVRSAFGDKRARAEEEENVFPSASRALGAAVYD